MRMSDSLLTAARLLRPRLSRLLLAVTLGVLALSSALALAAVSAWLITRAWQMPPVLDLSVAVVMVRALAISRGVLHYCERLATHDTALRAAGSARGRIYRGLARGPVDAVARLHSGQLVSRVGADVDELANVLVRAVLPIAVAAVLALAATTVVAAISAPAAAVLAACLLAAGVVAPYLAARATTAQETVARQHLSERDVAAIIALDHAPELRVGGALARVIAESTRRQRRWADVLDAAAKPAAVAEAMPTAAIGVSVLGAVVAGISMASSVAPTTLAILMLLPLSAFEATSALPGAAIQLTRSRIAARRLRELIPSDATRPVTRAATSPPPATARLTAVDISTAHPDATGSARMSVDLPPGARLAVTGPSGCGKTTLLMTLAGLLPPRLGRVELNGTPIDVLAESELRRAVCFFAEDAHIFATTVRDNLLVARGDCGDDELAEALHRVGLGRWLAGLPDGLATMLSGGAQALSAGQRRRLLLARALISPARILLLDEPTEHLDAADAEILLHDLLDPHGGLMTAARTVVVATHQLPNDIRCPQLCVGCDGYAGCRSSTPPDVER
ncbi:thiol reductant ABC exporter subunit CydC [Mycobacterium xenopi]